MDIQTFKKTSSLSDQIVLYLPRRFEVHGAHGGLVCPAGCAPKMEMRRGKHTQEGHDQSGMVFVDVSCSIGLPVVGCFDLQAAVGGS